MYYHRLARSAIFEGAYGGFSLETGKVSRPVIATNRDDWIQVPPACSSPPTRRSDRRIWATEQAQDGPNSFYFYLGRPF
jgi:NTE family protein